MSAPFLPELPMGDLEAISNHVAQIMRVTRLPDGQGGQIEGRTQVDRRKCRIWAIYTRRATGGNVRSHAWGALMIEGQWHRFYLPPDTDVRPGDEIWIESTEFRYRVLTVHNTSMAGHHLEVDTEDIH